MGHSIQMDKNANCTPTPFMQSTALIHIVKAKADAKLQPQNHSLSKVIALYSLGINAHAAVIRYFHKRNKPYFIYDWYQIQT